MQILEIASVPNQTFSTTLGEIRYDFAIYSCNGIMCFDCAINEVDVCNGFRITAGEFLIPFYKQNGGGNFLLLTQNGDLPAWQQFGLTQTFAYLTAAEIQAAVNAAAPYVAPFAPYAIA
jgi:hypothetical protein